ncbi:ATP-grasp domain-containing protein [Halorhodospira sp. M38]|nr:MULTISPECIES: ATP-grasp domain-containing protein [unclassified Halorhodospira]MCG5541867.1 ATP-grasp domain-containing protein [Halorhodospira sp. M39old]MCG5546942.1 ATP-grasp domain-containing protein [Halorhodospira sp. M38]
MAPDRLRQCLDKSKYSQICENTPLQTPTIWNLDDIPEIPSTAYPLVAKDIFGKGSRGQTHLQDAEEAQTFASNLRRAGCVDQHLIQPYLNGEEYGLDLVNDLDGQPAATFIRRKLAMRSGETDIAETVHEPDLEAAGQQLAQNLGHQGLIDCDVIQHDGKFYLLDINPRFGGGYVFSHNAGADVPACIVSWLKGHTPKKAWLTPKPGIRSARATSVITCREKAPRIIFITSGGSEIGMGHAYRQITLAKHAERKGYKADLVTDSSLVSELAKEHQLATHITDLDQKQGLQKLLNKLGPEAVIIDVHEGEFPKLRHVSRSWNTTLIVSRVGFGFDIFGTNAIFLGEQLTHWKTENRGPTSDHMTVEYSGRAYMLFREEFAEVTQAVDKGTDQTILIAHGGADPYGLTQFCLRALEHTDNTYNVDILVGPAFSDRAQIAKLADESKHHSQLIEGKKNVARYLSKATVALINGGNLRYELCLTGTPFLAISFQEAQYACTEQLSQFGVGINLGVMGSLSEQDVGSATERLLSDRDQRETMSTRMKQLFDTNGVERILGLALSENGSPK